MTNFGPSSATDITVTDILPAGAVLIGSNPSKGTVTNDAGQVTWKVGALAKDATANLLLQVQANIQTAVPVTITNTASVATASADPNPDDDTASATTDILPPTADLTLTLVGPADPVLLGNTLTYFLTVSNGGPATATEVTATDTLPPTLDFVSAMPAGYTVAGRLITFTNLGNLGIRGQANLTITARPTVAGTFTNSASCRSPAVTDPRKSNNSASAKTVVQQVPLTIARLGTDTLIISWPTNGGNYVLESTTNVSPPVVWAPVTNAVTSFAGGQVRVIVPIGPGNRYFRLRWTTAPVLTLSLSRSGNNITISWPLNPWNAYLESKPNLSAPNWTPAANPPPTVVGDQNTVTFPIGSANKFFRLHGATP